MNPFPHHYSARAKGSLEGPIDVSSNGLPVLETAAPAEFDGPGDQWSPETLLVAAAVDCFILTFRAVARASKLDWSGLECDADGQLDRADGVTRFTAMTLHAHLTVPANVDPERARRILDKAEKTCLVTNSFAFPTALMCEVDTGCATSSDCSPPSPT